MYAGCHTKKSDRWWRAGLLALMVHGVVCFFIFSHPASLPLPSFHTDSNENTNNDKNSITPISLSAITPLCPFPFLLKLYLTSSAVVRKQDYWYLSEMKVHFNAV